MMTRHVFDVQIGRLIVLKGWPDDVEEYWAALSDVPPDVFSAAVDHALKTRTWFPVPAELRADCDAVKARVRPQESVYPDAEDLPEPRVMEIPNPLGGPPLRVTLTREWKHDCWGCFDTGWASRWCGPAEQARPWQTSTHCGRRREHAAHEFVERCACLEWNPTIRRRKEAGAKYSQSAEKVPA